MQSLVVFSSLFLAIFAPKALAGFVEHNFTIGWVTANPDGRASREVIGINNAWPNPTIRATKGDTVIVHAHNNLVDQVTSLHWHGLHMKGYNQYDGPPGVVACEIPPGMSFTYEFEVKQPGTYWYHSHSPGQYLDGLRAPFIVDDPENPYGHEIDGEIIISLSDWYHDQMPQLLHYYLSPTQNPDGSEPVPYSALMSDTQNVTYPVQPNKTYMLRFVNMAGFSQMFVQIDQHNMTIIEADGVYTKKRTVESLYIATAQRYSVLVRTGNHATNFPITASMDIDDYDDLPDYVQPNVTGYLVYDASKPLPPAPTIGVWNIIDDLTLEPFVEEAPYGPVNHQIIANLSFFTAYGQNRAGFNNVSSISPKVPTLFTALSAPNEYIENPAIYGNLTNAFIYQEGDVIEIVINNFDTGPHPIHVHGHAPQILSRTGFIDPSGIENGENINTVNGSAANPVNPLRRDTWTVGPQGQVVVRYIADNPGVWFLHCHMDWHVVAGLTLTLIEAPKVIRKKQPYISQQMQQICAAQNVSTKGNAGGDFVNWLDLSNAPTGPASDDLSSLV